VKLPHDPRRIEALLVERAQRTLTDARARHGLTGAVSKRAFCEFDYESALAE
jgi:hypothetical protein